MQSKRKAKLPTLIGLTTKHAVSYELEIRTKLEIRSKLHGNIIELHTNMRSHVMFKEHISDWYDILQFKIL